MKQQFWREILAVPLGKRVFVTNAQKSVITMLRRRGHLFTVEHGEHQGHRGAWVTRTGGMKTDVKESTHAC